VTSEQLDNKIEQWFSEQFDFQIDFEIADALAKLERFSIVESVNGQYTGIVISVAKVELVSQWDRLFNFSKAPLTE
jgi:hypothetical protein